MKKILLLVAGLCLFTATANAADFTAGKDYTIINKDIAQQKTVKVIEFFNYGCPFCALAEPSVEKWEKTMPSYVDFSRVPLTFERGWDTYAKAYYLAEALGIEKQISPKLFLAIHGKDDRQFHDLSSPKAITDFFVKNGVKKSQAETAFNGGSPTIDAQVQYGSVLMKQYKVWAIPAFVVGDKYSVNLGQAKKPERLMEIVNYLIELAHKK